jgi:hypothetical protein
LTGDLAGEELIFLAGLWDLIEDFWGDANAGAANKTLSGK